MNQSIVAAFAKGATIRCRRRLGLVHLGNSDTYVCLTHYTHVEPPWMDLRRVILVFTNPFSEHIALVSKRINHVIHT
jgi:hypothetical protein